MDGRFFPAFLRMDGKDSLVVGGGAVALRKVASLIAGGARVVVVSPEVRREIIETPGVEIMRATYDPSMMHTGNRRWWMVFAATSNEMVNRQVCADAQAAGIWACNCGVPDDGDMVSPASRQVGAITIAVSTGGGSPSLAASLADQAVAGISAEQSTLAGLLPLWRAQVREMFGDETTRRNLMRALSGDEVIKAIKSGGQSAAAAYFDRLVAAARLKPERQGE